jgi:hypothetical protein
MSKLSAIGPYSLLLLTNVLRSTTLVVREIEVLLKD